MKKSTKSKTLLNYFLIVLLAFFIFLSLYLLLNIKISTVKNFQFSKVDEKLFLIGDDEIMQKNTKLIINTSENKYVLFIEIVEKIDGIYKFQILEKIPQKIDFEKVRSFSVITDKISILKILLYSFYTK